MSWPPEQASVEDVYRAQFGRLVAGLAARFGDLDLVEEMAQEAFVEAVRRWPLEGVPPNPGGWLTVVAGTGPWTGSGGSRAAGRGTRRRRCCITTTNGSRPRRAR
ncbi:MAG: hypothetical protein ABIU87_13840 [Ornithinibacter sp.]